MASDTDIREGQRFGRLKVVDPGRRIALSRGSRSAALCRCDCGQVKLVSLNHLSTGRVTSCGCQAANQPRVRVEPGCRSGMLTVVEEVRAADGARRLAVRCDCGTGTTRSLYAVAAGASKHCGGPAHRAARKPPAPRQGPPDLTGRRYGARVVLGVLRIAGPRRLWVRCDCGSEQLVTLQLLARSKSCGCIRPGNRVHGLGRHDLYQVHKAMMARCYRRDQKDYRNYGARGIEVYEPWHDVRVFIAEVEASIGPRPPGRYPSGWPLYTLDRIDNNGNYQPGNVQWSTWFEQRHNQRPRPVSTAA